MSVLVVRTYMEIAVLLTVGLGLGAACFWLAERFAGRQPTQPWLRMAQVLLVASLLLPPLARALLRPDALFPAPMQVQVWSADSPRPFHLALTGLAPMRSSGAPSGAASLDERGPRNPRPRAGGGERPGPRTPPL